MKHDMINPLQEIHMLIYSGLNNLKIQFEKLIEIQRDDVSVAKEPDVPSTGIYYITKVDGFGQKEQILLSWTTFVFSKFNIDGHVEDVIKAIRSAIACLTPPEQQNYLANIYTDIQKFMVALSEIEDPVNNILYNKLHQLHSHLQEFYPENYHPHEIKGVIKKLNWEGSISSLIAFFMLAAKDNSGGKLSLYAADAEIKDFICRSFSNKGNPIQLGTVDRNWTNPARIAEQHKRVAADVLNKKDPS